MKRLGFGKKYEMVSEVLDDMEFGEGWDLIPEEELKEEVKRYVVEICKELKIELKEGQLELMMERYIFELRK